MRILTKENHENGKTNETITEHVFRWLKTTHFHCYRISVIKNYNHSPCAFMVLVLACDKNGILEKNYLGNTMFRVLFWHDSNVIVSVTQT